ncbi:MAG: RDD family protein [Deltaproteobacteria bacterium]|nr:RDD family protein [Deltaproteobacteria bacterium]
MRTDALHQVETSEFVIFEFELAGLATRAAAWMIDAMVIGLLVGSIWFALAIASIVGGGVAVALAFVLSFLVQWGYFTILEWAWKGQTLGKKAVGLRVLTDRGLRPAFYQVLLRNLLRIIDSMPMTYLVGGLSAFASRSHQRLGDLVAGTIVVKERKRPLPSAILPEHERYNSFLEDRAAAEAARRLVPAALREVMISLSLRREEIETDARLLLFDRVALALVDAGVPRPRALSAERFVVGATAAILQGESGPRGKERRAHKRVPLGRGVG